MVGGCWKCVIRSVKSALKKTIFRRCLQRSELETVHHKIEACINSRPLTFVGDDLDCSPPLTPSNILTGKTVGFQPQLGPNTDLTDLNICSKDEAGRHTILEDRLD